MFSGATELKSELQVRAYGGVLGAPMDACYHLACDTVANVDVAETARNGSIAATALRALADGSLLP